MRFIEIKPSKKLQQFIECFWWMELDCGNGQDDFSERILPDGSSEIIFHLGDKVSRISEQKSFRREPNCFFIGQNTSHYNIAAQGLVKMLGIKFYPHTASFLLREDAAQFNDSIVDLSDIWGDSVKSVYERLGAATNLDARIALVENFLGECFRDEQSFQFAYLDFAVRRIVEGKGQMPLSPIVQKLGITSRYLEKLFFARVGISPKTFAQIVQLQNSMRLLAFCENWSLTDICYASGYYDQSHFIRAVKRFTGLKPSQLKREKMPMQQPFFDSLQN